MTDWDILSSYAGLSTLAVSSIYAGSFGSLSTPRKHSEPGAKQDEADNEEADTSERVSSEEAWLFPVFGSIALLGFYLIVKYIGKEWINWLLGWYFSLMGVGSVSKALIALSKTILGRDRWRRFDRNEIYFLKGSKKYASLAFRTPSLLLIPLGTIPSIIYNYTDGPAKSSLVTDILALSFSHNALSLLKIDSFKTGTILLSGLFLYDIWWVFGTEVMVKVATNLDLPIKLLWPKSAIFSTSKGFTMLGLGDIVVPGLFISLALRYDYSRHTRSNSRAPSFVKPYFYAALSSYVAGLVTTMTVMHTFKAAQPALLYLSPACILSFFITASLRGELSEAWAWSDEAPETEATSARHLHDSESKKQD